MTGTLSTTAYVGSGANISGDDSATTIIAGGLQYVGFDDGIGTATGTIIQSGGLQDVGVSGGTGTAFGADIQSSGKQYVGDSGGTGFANDATVENGGWQVVGNLGGTGTASATTIESGGFQGVGDDGIGTAIGAVIADGGFQDLGVNSGTGTASGTLILSGGLQGVGDIDGTGIAIGTIIFAGGLQNVGNGGTGSASDTTVNGSQFVYSGGVADASTVFNGGGINVQSGGVLDDVVIAGGSVLLNAGAVAEGTANFELGTYGTLDLVALGAGSSFSDDFTATIANFAGAGGTSSTSDVVKVAGVNASDQVVWTQSGTSGTLQVENGGSTLETLTFAGSYQQSEFSVSDSAGTDSIYISGATCYLAGTRILTPDGEAAVETLRPGDFVVTADGRSMRINWLGRQTISMVFADRLRVLPIRIKAGALAENTPARDLLVSPDHAIFIDGILVHAAALINATSVVRETDAPAVFSYYHVELDEHALLLAEGAPAESFVDNIDRLGFDNWDEYQTLYPEGKAVGEMPYPRAKSHRQVPAAVLAALAERALRIGAANAAEAA